MFRGVFKGINGVEWRTMRRLQETWFGMWPQSVNRLFATGKTAFMQFFPLRRADQRILGPLFITHCIHMVANTAISQWGFKALCGGLVLIMIHALPAPWTPWTHTWPAWLQLLCTLLMVDLVSYWIHRAEHVIPALWKIHSVHHSAEEVNFMVGTLIHPVEHLYAELAGIIPVYMMGISPSLQAANLFITFFLFLFIHSNIRYSFGPLKWLIVTPGYHYWHHNKDPETQHKNFCNFFPIWDWVFGTYYQPQKLSFPKQYGLDTPFPESYIGQLLYPFLPKKWIDVIDATNSSGNQEKSIDPNIMQFSLATPKTYEPLKPSSSNRLQ